VWLHVVELDALEAMQRATAWLETSRLPDGMTLEVSKDKDPRVLRPLKDPGHLTVNGTV